MRHPITKQDSLQTPQSDPGQPALATGSSYSNDLGSANIETKGVLFRELDDTRNNEMIRFAEMRSKDRNNTGAQCQDH